MILAEKIMTLRKKNGWSQEELAEQMNISRQSVSKWESGASIPDLERIVAMSKLFGVSTDYLLKDEEEKETPNAVVDVYEVPECRNITVEEADSFMGLSVKNAPPNGVSDHALYFITDSCGFTCGAGRVRKAGNQRKYGRGSGGIQSSGDDCYRSRNLYSLWNEE